MRRKAPCSLCNAWFNCRNGVILYKIHILTKFSLECTVPNYPGWFNPRSTGFYIIGSRVIFFILPYTREGIDIVVTAVLFSVRLIWGGKACYFSLCILVQMVSGSIKRSKCIMSNYWQSFSNVGKDHSRYDTGFSSLVSQYSSRTILDGWMGVLQSRVIPCFFRSYCVISHAHCFHSFHPSCLQ